MGFFYQYSIRWRSRAAVGGSWEAIWKLNRVCIWCSRLYCLGKNDGKSLRYPFFITLHLCAFDCLKKHLKHLQKPLNPDKNCISNHCHPFLPPNFESMSGIVLRGSGEGDSKNCLREVNNLLLKDELQLRKSGTYLQHKQQSLHTLAEKTLIFLLLPFQQT